jgi:hypothetical protein
MNFKETGAKIDFRLFAGGRTNFFDPRTIAV